MRFVVSLKSVIKIALLTLFFFAITYGGLYQSGKEVRIFRSAWMPCIDYFSSGTLYQGQMRCAYGPLVFFSGFLFKELSETFLQEIALITVIIINICVLLLINTVLKREKSKKDFFGVSITYLLLVYPLSITAFAATLSMFFLFVGFFILFYTKLVGREVWSGLLFALSFYSKSTSLVCIPFLVLFYVKDFHLSPIVGETKKACSFRLSRDMHRSLIKLSLSFAAAIIIGLWIYPNVMVYSVLAHKTQDTHSLAEVATFYLLQEGDSKANGVLLLPRYAIILSSIYLVIQKRSPYPIIALFGIALISITSTFYLGEAGQSVNYLLPTLPFFIVALLIPTHGSEKRIKKQPALSILLVILLIYPGITTFNPLVQMTRTKEINTHDTLLKDIEYGFRLIPPVNGLILIEGRQKEFNRFIEEYELPIENVQYGGITEEEGISHMDPIHMQELEKLLAKDKETHIANKYQVVDYQTTLTDKENKTIESLENGKYSLIIVGPKTGWGIITRILKHSNPNKLGKYCPVHIPDMTYFHRDGRHHTTLYFQNREACLKMRGQIKEYYQNKYEEICQQDQFAANKIVSIILRYNGIPQPESCQSKKDTITEYEKIHQIKSIDGIIIIAISILAYVIPQHIKIS